MNFSDVTSYKITAIYVYIAMSITPQVPALNKKNPNIFNISNPYLYAVTYTTLCIDKVTGIYIIT